MIDAGFDLDVQIERAALNRMIDGVLAMLLSQGQTQFPIRLPVISLPFGLSIDFGTLELDLTRGVISALRPRGATMQQVEADFVVEVDATLRDLIVFQQNLLPQPFLLGGLDFDLRNVDLGIERTAQGIPHALALAINTTHLQGVTPTATLLANLNAIPWPFPGASPIPRAFSLVLSLLTQALNVGFRIAAALVPHIPIPIKELVDAFVRYGLAFHTPASGALPPFVTAIADSFCMAADFQRVQPPPSGNPALIGDIRLPGSNIAAVASEGVLNQAIGILLQKGILPSSFKAGGFTWHVNQCMISLLGPASAPSPFVLPGTSTPLGAVEVFFAMKGRRGKCWCKVKVAVTIRARMHPYLEVSPIPAAPSTAQQQTAIVKLFFETQATVQISGFLVVVAELLIGPLLPVFLFLISQVANAILDDYLPFTFSTQVSHNGLNVQITVSSAKLAAYTTLAFDFHVAGGARGEAALDISPFTSFKLITDPVKFAALLPAVQGRVDIKVDYQAAAITIEDREIRLAGDISR